MKRGYSTLHFPLGMKWRCRIWRPQSRRAIVFGPFRLLAQFVLQGNLKVNVSALRRALGDGQAAGATS
jgi:hypothetical protein